MPYEAIVIGVSAGGLNALKILLAELPKSFSQPVIIVQHIGMRSDGFMVDYLNQQCALQVKEAEDKEPVKPGTVYLAPAGYHLLIEPECFFSLSVDSRVNYSCPSIDVLFESAAEVYGKSLIGIILTGANVDGAHGLKIIKESGGLTIVQNPVSAENPYMPQAALIAVKADYVVHLEGVVPLLLRLTLQEKAHGT